MTQTTQVPELSLSDYHDPQKREGFCEALFSGLKYFGFIILRDHGIDVAQLEEAYAASEAFFAQELDVKQRYIDESSHCQRGYVAFGREHAKDSSHPDLKEIWHIGREVSAQAPQAADYPPNIWPSEISEFKRIFNELYQSLDVTGQRVLEALTGPLGVQPDYFETLAAGGNSLFRLLHYPPLADDTPEGAVRAAAHEDINLLTLLVAASSSGLELLDRNGDWLPVEGSPHAIIVDAGDMLARITNNVIPATTHRVVNPTGPNISRYSMPFFMHPKSDAVLSCIEGCRNGQEQPDIIADDFLQQRLVEIGLNPT